MWELYQLNEHTHFDIRVEKVWRDVQSGKWYVNDCSYGQFNGIIAAVGTCGDPKVPHIPGQEKFKGPIYHSSDLDGKEAKVKKVSPDILLVMQALTVAEGATSREAEG